MIIIVCVVVQESLSEEMNEIKKCCTDCKTTKTPLWRGGPAGPKVNNHHHNPIDDASLFIISWSGFSTLISGPLFFSDFDLVFRFWFCSCVFVISYWFHTPLMFVLFFCIDSCFLDLGFQFWFLGCVFCIYFMLPWSVFLILISGLWVFSIT